MAREMPQCTPSSDSTWKWRRARRLRSRGPPARGRRPSWRPRMDSSRRCSSSRPCATPASCSPPAPPRSGLRRSSPASLRHAVGARGRRSPPLLVTLWGFANARRVARVVRVDVPIAGLPRRARRLHDRPDQRRPRRADDQAALRRGDRRRRQPRSTPTWSPSPAISSTARCASSPSTSRRSRGLRSQAGHVLRHRQPRVLLRRDGVGRASCAGSA